MGETLQKDQIFEWPVTLSLSKGNGFDEKYIGIGLESLTIC